MSQCFDCLISFCYYSFIYLLFIMILMIMIIIVFLFFLFLQEPWFLLWHYIMHLVRGSNLTVVVNFVVGDIKMAGAVPKTLTEGGG